MGLRRDPRAKVEFGDFQTPPALAGEVCRVLAARGARPRSIVEPTCGTGGLLAAALDAFPAYACALGTDVNDGHIAAARAALVGRPDPHRVVLACDDVFAASWPDRLAALPDPILVIGNPPWVTNSDLGALGSRNVPDKANPDRRGGLDAITGKSNFDVSEWMIGRLLGWLAGRDATLAMLCKASVARKVLASAWRAGQAMRAASYRIDAAAEFGAAVEACLLVCELAAEGEPRCDVYDRLDAAAPTSAIGFRDGAVIADVASYDRWRDLAGASTYAWRSGIKHDCAAVMQLRRTERGLENGDGEPVAVEDDRLYPLYKSSDVAREAPDDRDGTQAPRRYLIVPQRRVGDDTQALATSAPMTWQYLMSHRDRLDRRASAIYRGQPAFSIFGVGDYTFAPWKVAISGLYKKLAFCVVGPHAGKPVVFDDTCYFVACGSEAEARLVGALLASEPATAFFQSQVFWDAKRPITTELLGRLDLVRVAERLARADELHQLRHPAAAAPSPQPEQDQRDRERGQEDERPDPDEPRDADLDAGAAQ
jgi:hypothetical protein